MSIEGKFELGYPFLTKELEVLLNDKKLYFISLNIRYSNGIPEKAILTLGNRNQYKISKYCYINDGRDWKII